MKWNLFWNCLFLWRNIWETSRFDLTLKQLRFASIICDFYFLLELLVRYCAGNVWEKAIRCVEECQAWSCWGNRAAQRYVFISLCQTAWMNSLQSHKYAVNISSLKVSYVHSLSERLNIIHFIHGWISQRNIHALFSYTILLLLLLFAMWHYLWWLRIQSSLITLLLWCVKNVHL